MLNKIAILVSIAALFGIAHIARAAEGDTSNGCGLGWKVNSSVSLSGTSTRGTTNSTFGGPFGTTSGTSGCERYSIVKNDHKAIHYVEANIDALLRESATGQGETLDGLATTLGCEPRAFGAAMRADYGQLIDAGTPSLFLQETTSVKANISQKCMASGRI